ncbi:hypothetical protein [Kribbella endophytica]
MSDQQLKDLLVHVTDPVPDMDDAVPTSLVRGRRSVRRRRGAVAGAGLVAGALVVVGVVAIGNQVGGGDQSFAGSPAATPWQEPPISSEQRQFQRRVAAELDRLLPARFGKVAADSDFDGYRVRVADADFPITFRVGTPQRSGTPTCAKDQTVQSCVAKTIQPGGYPVEASQGVAHTNDGRTIVIPAARMLYQGNEVELTIFPLFASGSAVTISDQELLAVVSKPAFLDLVDEWASHPEWMPAGSRSTPTR